MTAPRSAIISLSLAVLASVSSALWSPVPPNDSLWRKCLGSRVLLTHSGDASLDDAIEDGFRQYWKESSYSWLPDTGIGNAAKDSVFLVFGLEEPWNLQRRTRERDCLKLAGEVRRLCFVDRSNATFVLRSVGDKLKGKNGALLLEQPSQTRFIRHGDAFAVDLVRDFALAIAVIHDGAFPVDGPVAGEETWARESIMRTGRIRAQADTLWIPRESSGAFTESKASEAYGGVVRFTYMDSLEEMMGTPRHGTYLEPGLTSIDHRLLRIRDFSTGDLLLDDECHSYDKRDSTLTVDDLRRLAHRKLGDEYRPTWLFSAAWEKSSSQLYGFSFLGGREMTRSVWLLAGYANQQYKQRYSMNFGEVGIRWTPLQGWDKPKLGPRLTLGARYWQPFRSGASDGKGSIDIAPRTSLDFDFLASYISIGMSYDIWFGKNRYVFGVPQKVSNWSTGREEIVTGETLPPNDLGFRFGFHFAIRDWHAGTPWKSAKESQGNRSNSPAGVR